jgi:quercetin dioxygenase-like cupin family protein
MHYEQVQTNVIDDESLPWVPFTPYAENVFLKYFKLDPIRGEMIVLMKAPAGMELPKHHHSGTVIAYTIEGRWKYKEHDWIAGPGSVVFETAASSHTPQAMGGEGHVVVLNIVVGDLIFLGENDQVLAIENWKTGMQRYLAYCEQAGIAPLDLTAFA